MESLARLVQNYLPSELVAMLFGLVVGHLKLPFGARGAQAIQRVNKTIEPLTDNIAELLLSRRNAVGIVIEALTRLDNATG